MISVRTIICKLGGQPNSSPEVIKSYPYLDPSSGQSKKLLLACLPMGTKIDTFSVGYHNKHNVISYAFKIMHSDDRGDLFTLSILLKKRLDAEIYKPILKIIIDKMREEQILTEAVLIKYTETIHLGINKEKNIKIGEYQVELSPIFEEIRIKLAKPKPELKGSFF